MRTLLVILLALLLVPDAHAFMAEKGIADIQQEFRDLPVGERIARWAEEFVGTPYDPDPLGEYVTRSVVVADERVDCMYLTFRSVELAISNTPGEAVEAALTMRFPGRGTLSEGKVIDYAWRFQYAMDMLKSGKWGRNVTGELLQTVEIEGSRGFDAVRIIPKKVLEGALAEGPAGLESGDIVFFVKEPAKRVVGEIIGHMGIVKREDGKAWLIHASGRKNKGGEVRKVLLKDYAGDMPFVGVIVSRF